MSILRIHFWTLHSSGQKCTPCSIMDTEMPSTTNGLPARSFLSANEEGPSTARTNLQSKSPQAAQLGDKHGLYLAKHCIACRTVSDRPAEK